MKMLLKIVVGFWGLALGWCTGVFIEDYLIVRDEAVLVVAACPNRPVIAWFRSDGSIEAGPAPRGETREWATSMERIDLIPKARRVLVQYPCPSPPAPRVY